MIRAVFFDWYNTLARYEPPREEVQVAACRSAGIETSVGTIRKALPAGDLFYARENTRSPVEKRPPEEKARAYYQYQKTVLREAGIEATETQLSTMMKKLGELSRNYVFVLFDDVVPALQALKSRGLRLGMISNIAQDMDSSVIRLGLSSLLDFVVTSGKAGADKPDPRIFAFALEQAGIRAPEAIHVGDQYQLDVAGAKGAGLRALLLDRYDLFPEVTDCPRIRGLSEIEAHLS